MNEKSLPMASYHAVQEELANMVQEVETSGWLIRVGDVFSNGDQVYHIRIKRIVAGEEDADDSMIFGTSNNKGLRLLVNGRIV